MTRTTRSRFGRSVRVAVAAALAAVGFAGAGNVPARAQDCWNPIVIYSQPGVVAEPVSTVSSATTFRPDANKDFPYCGGDVSAPYDLRVINPGSTMVMVRVFGYSGPGPLGLELSGIINKRGIKMSYVPPAPPLRGGTFYDSPWIPLNPIRSGTLTATLNRVYGSTVYHTVD